MNTIEDIIKLAEFEGWTQIENGNTMAISGCWRGYPPENAIIGKKEPLPDYFNDLNATHKLEKKLIFSRRQIFYNRLRQICSKGLVGAVVSPEFCIHATATQRANAILETQYLLRHPI
jgi:hypothetical protein